jgi:hypothetical protein
MLLPGLTDSAPHAIHVTVTNNMKVIRSRGFTTANGEQ